MPDKDDPQKVVRIWQTTLSDKTKPATYRCKDTFTTYLTDDKKLKLQESLPDLIDERATFLVQEFIGMASGSVKTKGVLLPGWLTERELSALQAPTTPPTATVITKPDARPVVSPSK